MITEIHLANVKDAAVRKQMVAAYFRALADDDTKLRLKEAAWLYGYCYATLRWYVANGRLKHTGRGSATRVTHAAMREMIRNKKAAGTPRKALKAGQQRLG